MYARVNYRQIPPDKMDEAIRMYRDTTLPERKTHKGFVGGYVLTDRSTGKILAISLWETQADMSAAGAPGYVDAVAGGPPVQEVYEVIAEDKLLEDRLLVEESKTTHARVSTRQIQPGKIDETVRAYQDSNVPHMRAQKGSRGAFGLIDRSIGKVLGITLWETEADMMGRQPTPGTIDAVAVGQTTREIYEVSMEV